MHKPITTPDAEATAITAVAVFSGLMEAGHAAVYTAWNEGDMGGGVELFALCAAYGRVSEGALTELAGAENPPFNFPGVYDYDVGETFGTYLRAMILRNEDPNHSDNAVLAKHELGRLMLEFFMADEDFAKNPAYADIIERHTGYKKA